MNLHAIKSVIALRGALALFGPFDTFAVTGKDIEVFKLEECEVCGVKVKGANSVNIPSAQKWVHDWFFNSKLKKAPINLEEICCDEDGICSCESCWCKNENDKNEACEA